MDFSKMRPLGNRIIIKNVEEDHSSVGGIIIPTTKNERLKEGEVVAAGPGKYDNNGNLIPMSTKVGDRVLYGKHAVIELTAGSDQLLVALDEEIVGIF